MPRAQILDVPQGLRPPERLEFSGAAAYGADGGPVEFALDWIDEHGGSGLHLNPRPGDGVVVLNDCCQGGWGDEIVLRDYPFPRDPHTAFRLTFDVLPDRFRILVDAEEICGFPHRVDPRSLVALHSTIFLWRLDPGSDVALTP